MLDVGTEAPDFTLKDQNGQPVTLSNFRGVKNVLVVFFPLAFTGICQGELDEIRDHLHKSVGSGLNKAVGARNRRTALTCCFISRRPPGVIRRWP